MNQIERKLYRIINEDEVVKNKKTGNVYTVKTFNPSVHDKPLVKRSNKFAEDMGIRAKAADTGAAGGPQPITK